MNVEIDQTPIVVYYKFRGQVQPIRNFFCYLAIPFIEIHLQRLEEQKRELPSKVIQKLLKIKIDRSQLPSLIHEDRLIEGPLPVMTYVCKRFNHQDLLGSDMRARAKVQEVLQIYFVKQPQSMIQLFNMAQFASKSTCKQTVDHYMNKTFENVMTSSKYIKQLCQMLDIQQQPRYVLDFFFIQTCFYMLGMFNSGQRVAFEELNYWQPENTHFLEKPNSYYVKVMQRYLDSMRSEPFYHRNKEYLQSFSIVSALISEQKVKGLRKVWLGNEKFVL